MTHLDDELLAELALDARTPDPGAADHLRLCDRCRESLAQLQEVAQVRAELPRLELPPAHVWDQIRSEVGLSTPVGETVDHARTRSRGLTRRSLALAASVAAVLGLGAGVAGTLLLTGRDRGPANRVEAMIRLEPLAGKTGDGNADLIRSPAGNELKVAASGLATTPGFYEVWLINVDGKRMVSLGVLNPRSGGTFQIPTEVTAEGYRIVDVSLEPNDGNPEHSHDSIIRGTLPS